MQLTLDPVLSAAAAAVAGAVVWYVKEMAKDRREQTAILASIAKALTQLEERTAWMVRRRRPTPLDSGAAAAAPEEVEHDLTPVAGLRALRARAHTPPAGSPTEYSHPRKRR